ncbi:unnamed protein product [Pylaiella littoralis]
MTSSRLFLALLYLAPLYVSAFVGCPAASLARQRVISVPKQWRTYALPRHSSASLGVSMMGAPFELPQGSKEEAVAAFDEAVLKQEVPTLVYFHAKWCGPCIMQGPVFEKIAEDYDERVKVVKLDCDNHQFLMNKYRVRGLPFTCLFDNGKVIARHEGHLGYEGQVEFLRKVPDFDV